MDLQDEPFWRAPRLSVQEGEERSFDGRLVHLEPLVRRFWGWTSGAAKRAAPLLRQWASDGRPLIWLADGERRAQQDRLFSTLPDLTETLCRGLAHGSSKELPHADREVVSVTFQFTRPITDDGLISGMMRALAVRLACTVDDVRKASTFDRTYDERVRHVTVVVSDFDAK